MSTGAQTSKKPKTYLLTQDFILFCCCLLICQATRELLKREHDNPTRRKQETNTHAYFSITTSPISNQLDSMDEKSRRDCVVIGLIDDREWRSSATLPNSAHAKRAQAARTLRRGKSTWQICVKKCKAELNIHAAKLTTPRMIAPRDAWGGTFSTHLRDGEIGHGLSGDVTGWYLMIVRVTFAVIRIVTRVIDVAIRSDHFVTYSHWSEFYLILEWCEVFDI